MRQAPKSELGDPCGRAPKNKGNDLLLPTDMNFWVMSSIVPRFMHSCTPSNPRAFNLATVADWIIYGYPYIVFVTVYSWYSCTCLCVFFLPANIAIAGHIATIQLFKMKAFIRTYV